MSKIDEATRNDIRKIGEELSTVEFKILTVVGIDQNDGLNNLRLEEARELVRRAARVLSDIITRDVQLNPNAGHETEART